MEVKETEDRFALRLINSGWTKERVIEALIGRGCPTPYAEQLFAIASKAANPVPAAQLLSQKKRANSAGKRDKRLQRLLLLHVRDGVEPPELSAYSTEQQVYNSALLIDEGLLDGSVIRDNTGFPAATSSVALTSKGHDCLDETENQTPAPAANAASPMSQPKQAAAPGATRLVFISHSSQDKKLAEALLDMLCAALRLTRRDFLCTSVDGARLRGGDLTDVALRQQIQDVPAFLSLLTPRSVTSTYVLFELGARWGFDKHNIPLLAKGAGDEVLKEPLKARNGLHLNQQAEVVQLAENLAELLGREMEPVSGFLHLVHEVVRLASDPSLAANEPTSSTIEHPLKLAEIERRARTRAAQCAYTLRQCGVRTAVALESLDLLQAELELKYEQIALIADGRILFHHQTDMVGKLADSCWIANSPEATSLYTVMKAERSGVQLVRIKGHPRRVTAVAFEHLGAPDCIAVAEAHCYE